MVQADWNAHGNHPVLVAWQNEAWLIYQALDGQGCGQVVARRDSDGEIHPLSSPGIDCAGLAATACTGGLLVVWSQFVAGAYQLYGGYMGGTVQQITTAPSSAMCPCLAVDTAELPWLAYQAADKQGQFAIYLTALSGQEWRSPQQISDTPGNNWAPALAACSEGALAIGWDCHAAGSYDVYLRFRTADGHLTPTRRLSCDDAFHANLSLSPAPDGAVWAAWNRGTRAWGQDNHPYRTGRIYENNYLHARRSLEVRRVTMEDVWPVFPDLQADILDMVLPGQHYERPWLCSVPEGPLYLAFRFNAGEPTGGHRNEKRWQAMVTCYDGDRWHSPVELPEAYGISTGGLTLLPRSDGNLLAAAAGEGGDTPGTMAETKTQQYLLTDWPSVLTLAAPSVQAEWLPADAVRPQPRRHAVQHDGKTYHLYRGDLHRHTELSDCRTCIDGSLEDVFRYARDAADLDFVMSADHENSAPDLWMETLQAADKYYVPGHFTTFFGYEAILSSKNRRHRNVVSTQRISTPSEHYAWHGSDGSDERHRSVRDIWATLERGMAITLAHHTACGMSLRWGMDPGEASDLVFEPLVEIFQASRGSSEYVGAPTVLNHFSRSNSYTRTFTVEEGTVAAALRRGLHMGFVASSDHMSTHQSYACVYATANTREALMEAMLARRTYAASDDIICEFHLGGGFMGEKVQVNGAMLDLHIRFIGTGPIKEVVLLRDSVPWQTWHPQGRDVEIHAMLPASECAGHYFYARLQQQDTNLAWSSPVWVEA